MILSPIEISNFKSIRKVGFEAKRVNIFIGEPNTGKSNIIEALSFFSQGMFNHFPEILRFKSTADLFFDQKIGQAVAVRIGRWKVELKFENGAFNGVFQENDRQVVAFHMSHKGFSGGGNPNAAVRLYKFKAMATFPNGQPGTLSPPFGDNLVAVLYSNEELRKKVGTVFRSQGFRLQIKPTENELLIAKDVQDELYSYPWGSVSETLRRIVFYMAMLETNKDSVLLLDEPEAHTFPFYTKYLAERLALDETNQFFITTHNPYLLSSIVEKTQSQDLAVFVASLEQFETKLRRIPQARLPQLLDLGADAFFNLNRLIDE